MPHNTSPIPLNTDLELKIVRATLLSRPSPQQEENDEPVQEKNNHLLAFSVSIRNRGKEAIRLTGKKWVIEHADKTFDVFESSQVFNTRPLLLPGQIFAFNGYHLVLPPAGLHLTLLGKNESSAVFRSKTVVIHPPGKEQ